ncbi:SGNH/GDSL hydrolase family protein [Amycolatopsis sp. H20-H5]|uniref:SGNH/GDSL hydrolase family protein n=1 Tax=Amycolatopsis sp. H20-H5 TaxID=3046309 RepID=UPI002DB7F11D|nr:SGNH/GDSL hydrolase family protein [Amycolatopsis sp. H20-H5]MEC3976505.1 SGNH/GDSL hydrolase family protein [Amycolatopsis sp. H20-H5]
MAKKSGGGCLVLVIVAGLAIFGYYQWQKGSSAAPPSGDDTGGGTGRYVALGDSYTSAPRTGAAAGTPPGCDRSANNYPHLVSASIKPAEFVDVSCSGAVTASMTGTQKTANGTNPAQLDAVTKTTTLVTVGIGGNDVGFIALAQQCTTVHPNGAACRDRLTADGHDQLAERTAATAPKIAALLDTIHTKAPKAQIIVVGYPTVLPDGDGCWPALPVGSGDVAYLRDSLANLNTMLSDQAKAHKAGYADTATPSKGHDLCTASDTRWTEGIVPTSHAIPLHPNAKGEQAMAETVENLVKTP